MSIEAALTAFLVSDADVQAIAGNRVYPLALPQGASFPAITYYRTSQEAVKSFAGLSGLSRATLTVDVWATNYSDAKALADAIRGNRSAQKLDGFRGTIGNVNIESCFCTAEIDLHEKPVHGDERGVYHTALDFEFWYEDIQGAGSPLNLGMPFSAVAGGGVSPGGITGQLQYNNGGAFGGAAGVVYNPTASPNILHQAQATGQVPVVFKAITSQTSDFIQWQDVNGNILTKLDVNGRFYFGSNPPVGFGESISATGNIVLRGYVLSLQGNWNLNMGVDGPRRVGLQSACYIEFGSSDGTGVPAIVLDTTTGNTFTTQKLISGRNAGSEKYGVTAAGEIFTNAGFASAIVNKTAAYTLTISDSFVTADATSAAFAVTLPAANGVIAGREYTVKKIDSGVNAVTLTAAGTDKIDGSATFALSSQYKYVKVKGDGSSKWWVVANN